MLIKSISLVFLLAVFSANASSGNDADKNSIKDINKVERGAEPVKEKGSASTKEKSSESIAEKWGVGNFKVRHTSAGYMLDIRYYVFDSAKAKPLFSRKLRPFVIEEASAIKY